jgi:hypothetical protein
MHESGYKIIAIQKKHPIFICKAIPVGNHHEPLMRLTKHTP